MFENFWKRLAEVFAENPTYLLSALGNTIVIAFCGFAIGLIIGTGIALIRVSPKNKWAKALDYITAFYVLVIRGTPIVVQLLLMYFVILSPLRLPAMLIAILVFGINSGAYMSETLRGAIKGIDKGQLEAGMASGLSYTTTMGSIVLPQAFKNVLPQLGNEIITLVKETSVVGFITVIDITRAAQLIVARTYDAMAAYVALAIIYLCVVYLLTLGIKLVENYLVN